MRIRQEQPADYDEVHKLVELAFATAAHFDGTEADYLSELRQKEAFIPELSLVAETDGGKLVGQIVLYKANVTTPNGMAAALLLSPLCVHPDYFRRGIARALVDQACALAKAMGFGAVFLCGEPDIYKKLGFAPSCEHGIFHVRDESKTAPWSMVRELYPGALRGITGTVDTV